MKSITVQEFKAKSDANESFQLIDVREEHEVEICTLNGVNIPMATILQNVDKVRRDIPVIVHCKGGKRSAAVIHTLQTQFGYDNLINLTGGIMQYAEEIDTSLETY